MSVERARAGSRGRRERKMAVEAKKARKEGHRCHKKREGELNTGNLKE